MLHLIVTIEPATEHLLKLVAPKIATHWDTVAYNLQLDSSSVRSIAKRRNSVPFDCAHDMLIEWQNNSTECSWEILLDAVRQVDSLQDACTELLSELEP